MTIAAVALGAAGCGSSPTTRTTSNGGTPVTGTGAGNVLAVVSDAPELNILTTAIGAADFTTRLEDSGPYTLFAPTDKAWKALGENRLEGLLTRQTKNLRQGLLNHMVDRAVPSSELTDGTRLKSMGGPDIVVRTNGPEITVNGARVIRADQTAPNGVVHVIDKVMR